MPPRCDRRNTIGVLLYFRKIELPKVDTKTNKTIVRCAPSFIPGDANRISVRIYNARQIGEFLGWVYSDGRHNQKIDTCLTALQYVEEGILTLKEFEKLNTAQMVALIEQTRNAREQLETVQSSVLALWCEANLLSSLSIEPIELFYKRNALRNSFR
jgi:hypothetical protein